MEQKTGTAAILAIVAAIGGILLVFSGNPGWALIVELIALVCGALGFFMAVSPRVSGAILSIAAMIIAGLAFPFWD